MKRRRDPVADAEFAQRHLGWLLNGHLPAKKDDITVIPLAELLRRDQETNDRDGYPASSTGGGSHGGDISRPTESVALKTWEAERGETKPPSPDQLHHAVHGIEEHLARARDHLQSAVSLSYLVHRLQHPPRKTNEPTPCKACERLVACSEADPIRKGYCDACRHAWERWCTKERAEGREPDRATFERTRREEPAA